MGDEYILMVARFVEMISKASMSYADEFSTVDNLISSAAETRAVDAFALSLIKAEKQMRKLVTHLVYQFPCFQSKDDKDALRNALASKKVYFEDLERGFNELYSKSIETLIGSDYKSLKSRLIETRQHRNKIFHGQITSEKLSRPQLLAYVKDIRQWCEILAKNTLIEFKYNGFERNSFRKSTIPNLHERFKVQMASVHDYEKFISEKMAKR